MSSVSTTYQNKALGSVDEAIDLFFLRLSWWCRGLYTVLERTPALNPSETLFETIRYLIRNKQEYPWSRCEGVVLYAYRYEDVHNYRIMLETIGSRSWNQAYYFVDTGIMWFTERAFLADAIIVRYNHLGSRRYFFGSDSTEQTPSHVTDRLIPLCQRVYYRYAQRYRSTTRFVRSILPPDLVSVVTSFVTAFRGPDPLNFRWVSWGPGKKSAKSR